MAPRHIYASTARRRDRRWGRSRRREAAVWLPLGMVALAAVLTEVLRVVG